MDTRKLYRSDIEELEVHFGERIEALKKQLTTIRELNKKLESCVQELEEAANCAPSEEPYEAEGTISLESDGDIELELGTFITTYHHWVTSYGADTQPLYNARLDKIKDLFSRYTTPTLVKMCQKTTGNTRYRETSREAIFRLLMEQGNRTLAGPNQEGAFGSTYLRNIFSRRNRLSSQVNRVQYHNTIYNTTRLITNLTPS